MQIIVDSTMISIKKICTEILQNHVGKVYMIHIEQLRIRNTLVGMYGLWY